MVTEALPLTDPDSEPITPRLEIDAEEETKPEENIEEVTREAQDALAQYGVQEKITIETMLRLGAAVAKAKAKLKHGEFTRWCEEVLQRKPSWCSAHRRLFELQEFIEPAMASARGTGHRWAYCTSVERLLKLIAEYKRAEGGDQPPCRKLGNKPRPSEVIAELRAWIEEAKAEFVAMRDRLPQHVEVEVVELVSAIESHGNETAKARLSEISRRFHWRYRDLIELGTCGAPQVSEPLSDETAVVVPGNPETVRSAKKVNAAHNIEVKRPPRGGLSISWKMRRSTYTVSPVKPWGRQ
jgi:hypothetical protein